MRPSGCSTLSVSLTSSSRLGRRCGRSRRLIGRAISGPQRLTGLRSSGREVGSFTTSTDKVSATGPGRVRSCEMGPVRRLATRRRTR